MLASVFKPNLLLFWLFLTLIVVAPCGTVRAAGPLTFEFEGVDGVLRENLAAALVPPPNLLRDGAVDQRWLQRFVDQVPATANKALQPFGYYRPSIETELREVDPTSYVLKIRIELGPAIRLARLQIDLSGSGTHNGKLVALLEEFPLKQGDVLHQGVYEEGKAALKRRAQDLGYLDADYTVHEIRLDVDRATADVELLLQTGPRYRFGAVTFTGADQYPESFLRRYLAFDAGDVFSYARLGDTQLNLLDADRFEEIRVLPDRSKMVDEMIPVGIALTPGATMRLRPGIGYGTDTGARLSLSFDHFNIFEQGHALNLQLNLSQIRQAVIASYIIPDDENQHNATALRAGYENEENDTFDTEKITVEIERMRDLGRGRKGSLYVQLFQEKSTVGDVTDTSRMILPGVRYSRRRYRDLVRPRKGHQYEFEVRGGHQWLGSDTGLVQVLAAGNLLLPLPARMTLFSRVEGDIQPRTSLWWMFPLRFDSLPVEIRVFGAMRINPWGRRMKRER
ncbi:autotransporter assembly complex protein TamA [Syntrophotalea acetylenivorans]|uniref:autotransporter assembly complex protein TamA n=1 Tax=Syntrophotalea acetylenivorans TaxID=1842532 RepID=UPI001314A7C4|nr:POTRA domain-containing protein [Syntrophotalea acetylenivorans]